MNRRNFLHLAKEATMSALTLSLLYQLADYISPRMELSYSLDSLVSDLPTLEKIIKREGEIYFSSPMKRQAAAEVEQITSVEQVRKEIYPYLVEHSNYFLGMVQQKTATLAPYIPVHTGTTISGGLAVTLLGSSLLVKPGLGKRLLLIGGAMGAAGFSEKYFNTSGIYNEQEGEIELNLPNSRLATTFFLSHENAHSLMRRDSFDRFPPAWVTEGFAEALAYLTMDHAKAIPPTQNFVRERSLQMLVSTYRLACEKEEVEQQLPPKYDQFDSHILGIRLTNAYWMGYSFFRIRAEQRGNDIFRRILIDKNLAALEPLPSEKFTDIWL